MHFLRPPAFKRPPLSPQLNKLALLKQLAKPAGVTSHWGMQCRWVSGCKQCLKGSGPVARIMPSQLRAGVPPLCPQHKVGAAPPNNKRNCLLRNVSSSVEVQHSNCPLDERCDRTYGWNFQKTIQDLVLWLLFLTASV